MNNIKETWFICTGGSWLQTRTWNMVLWSYKHGPLAACMYLRTMPNYALPKVFMHCTYMDYANVFVFCFLTYEILCFLVFWVRYPRRGRCLVFFTIVILAFVARNLAFCSVFRKDLGLYYNWIYITKPNLQYS